MNTKCPIDNVFSEDKVNVVNDALTISIRETYVYACVRKAIATRKFAVACMEKAAEKAREQGVNKIMLDVRDAPNKLSVLDNYQIPYYVLKQVGYTHDIRTALIVHPDDKTHDFMETVAVNAGFDFKLFTDEEIAVHWLKR